MQVFFRYRNAFLRRSVFHRHSLQERPQDGEKLSDLLSEGFMKEACATLAEVRAALQNAELMKQEAKDATKKQNSAVADAKVWRRKVVKRGDKGHEVHNRYSSPIPSRPSTRRRGCSISS